MTAPFSSFATFIVSGLPMSHAHHAHHAHEASHASEADPIEAVTPYIPYVLPIAGGVLIFLLAFIAVVMA
mgnify:CR=1 FL=1